MESGSRWHTYGSSSGWSSNIINSASGEHLERKHFYLDITVNEINTLNSGLKPEEASIFSDAFSQTASSKYLPAIEKHHFELTNAYRISDYSECKIPTACLSINPSRNTTDNQFYPIRDTCGCCAHTSVEKAILGSLKESLERQFLLKFWLTKIATAKIDNETAFNALQHSPTKELIKELAKTGNICILDLTDNRFPGTCILLCYGNDTDISSPIKYCTGMAYFDDLTTALEKAVIELWQTYRFMYSFTTRGKLISDIEDPYLKHFLSCNSYETYIDISHSIATGNRQAEPKSLSIQRIIESIKKIKLDGYLYLSHLQTHHSTSYFCKYVSPNIFLHMNNSSNFNLKNKYSQDFLHAILPEQQKTMVPFP
ncbi:YcaO-like family protein [Pseudomonas sp. X10]